MIYRLQKKMILICGGALILVFSVLFLMIALAGTGQLNTAMDSFIDGIVENGGRPQEPDPGLEVPSPAAPQMIFRENARFDIRFFIAYFDREGNYLSASIDSEPEINEKEARKYSLDAFREKAGRVFRLSLPAV